MSDHTGKRTALFVMRIFIMGAFILSPMFPFAAVPASAQSNPTIAAWPVDDRVAASGWPTESIVTVWVTDGSGSPTNVGSGQPEIPDWDPDTTFIEFTMPEGLDLNAGDYIQVSDSMNYATKDHTVTELDITHVAPLTDTAYGVAASGSTVELSIHGEPTGWTQAEAEDGVWSKNLLSSLGFDIVAGTGVIATQHDADGDWTHVEWFVPVPRITAGLTWNWIELHGFTPNSTATVAVYGYQGGTLLSNPPLSLPTNEVGHGVIDWADLGIDLIPEMFVVATDDATGLLKELVLVDLVVNAADYQADTVGGTAPDGASVWVHVEEGGTSSSREVNAAGGTWAAYFSQPPEEAFNITESTGIQARIFDEDGDATAADLVLAPPVDDQDADGIPDSEDNCPYTYNPGQQDLDSDGIGDACEPHPALHAVPAHPEVHGHSWNPEAIVTLTITRPGTSDTYSETKPVNHEPLDFCDNPCFDLTGLWDLQEDDVVTMADDFGYSATVHVTALALTEVDLGGDTVSGTAAPGSEVWVDIHSPGGVSRHVVVDQNGQWTADFSVFGDEEWEQNTFDLVVGTGGRSIQFENPYPDDGTLAYWPRPPRFITGTISPNPLLVGNQVTITADFMGFTYDRSLSSSPIQRMEYVLFGYTDWTEMAYDAGDPVAHGEATLVVDTQGVYPVVVRAFDAAGEEAGEFLGFLVVYDPEGGFVTGGGWIWSPLGAFAADPSLEGKASLGFVSKYKKGAIVPSGQTEFQFRLADLNFKSTSYDWLVVAGRKAMFKGLGTINGQGEYQFMLTAIDGDLKAGDGVDRFRIRIWYQGQNGSEIAVYDNQMGDYLGADPTTALGGGEIVIHKAQ